MMKSLQSKLLISHPKLKDRVFSESIILLCEHSKDSAFGIMINKPIELNVHELIMQVNKNDMPMSNQQYAQPVLHGGPLKRDQGFVIHNSDQPWKSSKAINQNINITSSKDIIEAIGLNEFKDDFIIVLGHASWGKGQLEAEIMRNDWFVLELDEELIFNIHYNQRWLHSLKCLGLSDLSLLSPEFGHA